MRLEQKYLMFSPFDISSNLLYTVLNIQLCLIINTQVQYLGPQGLKRIFKIEFIELPSCRAVKLLLSPEILFFTSKLCSLFISQRLEGNCKSKPSLYLVLKRGNQFAIPLSESLPRLAIAIKTFSSCTESTIKTLKKNGNGEGL